MMNRRTNAMAKSRDFGLPAVGKGDKSRVTDPKTFNANFSEIGFSVPPEGFKKVGHKSVKKYT